MFTVMYIFLLSAAILANVSAAGQEKFIQNPCSPNHCMNAGQCSLVELDKGVLDYSCKCNSHYAGKNCRIFCKPKEWLGKACSTDVDCTISLSGEQLSADNADRQPKCFKGKCLCPVGQYYSIAQRFCVKYCHPDDLQSTFTVYPGSGINGHNDYKWNIKNMNEAHLCQGFCANKPDCKNFETNGKHCYGAKVNMVPGITYTTTSKTWDHHQRNCA